MYWEIVIIAIIIMFVLISTGQINFNELIEDNAQMFKRFKEDDWDFYVKARYGNRVNPDLLFNSRLKNAGIVLFLGFVFILGKFSIITIILVIAAAIGMFKLSYLQLKSYYKVHINEIDAMLPHYLKSIEILIQHYTVPVALGKSMEDAPPIFREGLQEMVNAINSGDDSIKPYMDFAKMYPVRDSMRMMRLLYRLSIGRQERKQEQLLAFSKSISNLQQKARDTKYKNRLEKMEGMTMKMLISTGVGVMILLVLSVLQMIDL